MNSNPDVQYEIALARLSQLRADIARENLATQARGSSHSRLRDSAFWASVIGPLIGVGFVTYFVQEIGRSVG